MIPDLIKKYSFQEILAIEESDRQFLALQSAWELLKNTRVWSCDPEIVQQVFLQAVIYNALISYQIAWSGELWWEEFSQKLVSDFVLLLEDFLQWKNSFDRWYNLMITSKYNKRLYNIKLSRLKKISQFESNRLHWYYDHMTQFWQDLSSIMAVDPLSKTMSFTVKMFGYAARSVYARFVAYPMEVPIPVDSRIRRLFLAEYGGISDKEIISKVYQFSQETEIPPLHLDSLFWIPRKNN
jgi:DNA-(apurinic or apyrimidinic site) lyase